MDKISTPYCNITSHSSQSQHKSRRTSPAASTLSFLRQFARQCYVDVNTGSKFPPISLN